MERGGGQVELEYEVGDNSLYLQKDVRSQHAIRSSHKRFIRRKELVGPNIARFYQSSENESFTIDSDGMLVSIWIACDLANDPVMPSDVGKQQDWPQFFAAKVRKWKPQEYYLPF